MYTAHTKSSAYCIDSKLLAGPSTILNCSLKENKQRKKRHEKEIHFAFSIESKFKMAFSPMDVCESSCF